MEEVMRLKLMMEDDLLMMEDLMEDTKWMKYLIKCVWWMI